MSALEYNAWRKHYTCGLERKCAYFASKGLIIPKKHVFPVILKTEIGVHSCYPVNYFKDRHIAYLSFH